jgi:hypothetical protein
MSKHLQIHVYEGMIEIKKFNFGKKDEKLSNWEDSVKLDSQQNLKEQMKQMNNENKNRNKNENNKFESKNQNKLDNRNENTKFDNRNENIRLFIIESFLLHGCITAVIWSVFDYSVKYA